LINMRSQNMGTLQHNVYLFAPDSHRRAFVKIKLY
jgi:hypothetical protein